MKNVTNNITKDLLKSQCTLYDLIANKDLYHPKEIIEWCLTNCKFWCFQLEKGNGETEYEHWYIRINLKVKCYSHLLKNKFNDSFKEPNYHKRPQTINKSSMDYVFKEDSCLYGPWTDKNYNTNIKYFNEIINISRPEDDPEHIFKNPNIFVPYHLDGIRYATLFPWQKAIIISGKVENRDNRKIDLIIDPIGNIGKLTLSYYCDFLNIGIMIPRINDYDKIVCTLCNRLMTKQERDPKILFFNLPRNITINELRSFLCAIEIIKRGRVYELRNSYKEWRFHPPRVWIFSNDMLPVELLELLQADCWNFWRVDPDTKELINYDTLQYTFVK